MFSRLNPTNRAAMALAATLLIASSAFAAKGGKGGPGGSEPAPPGTIYYRTTGDATYAMDADGNNKRLVPGINGYHLGGTVSSGVYGSDPQLDRLWLDGEYDGRTYDYAFNSLGQEAFNLPHGELYVVFSSASGDNYVQLTDFFGKIMVSTSPEGLRWSSDGQDSFITFYGRDLTNGAFYQDPDTGETIINWDNTEEKLFRIHVSGAEIAARILADDWTPIVDDRGGTDPYVEEIGPYSPLAHWCPDGHRFVYTEKNGTSQAEPTYVVDLDDVDPDTGLPRRTLLWVDPAVSRVFVWSPLPFSDGEYRILFYNGYPGEQGIYTIKPDGTELTPVALNGQMDYKVNPAWSTDNRYIVYERSKLEGWDHSYTLFRIPTPGTGTSGKAVALTNDLDSRDLQQPLAWVPQP